MRWCKLLAITALVRPMRTATLRVASEFAGLVGCKLAPLTVRAANRRGSRPSGTETKPDRTTRVLPGFAWYAREDSNL
jgi:hypothetical protein